MNRLAPLVVRRSGTAAMAAPMPAAGKAAAAAPATSDDLRLFVMTYLAGFVFFGTWIA
jgi:hypothetical protein